MPSYSDTYKNIGSKAGSLLGSLGDVGGSSASKLTNMTEFTPYLQGIAKTGSQALEGMRKSALGDINKSRAKALTGVRERLAQQGLNSPLGINLENEVAANADAATNQANLGFAQQQEQAKNQAIQQLFGIDSAQLQALGLDRNFLNQLMSTQLQTAGLEQQDYWNKRQEKQQENAMWGQLLGSGLGAAANLYGASQGWFKG